MGNNAKVGGAYVAFDGTATATGFNTIQLSQASALSNAAAAAALFEAADADDTKMVLADTKTILLFVGDNDGNDYDGQLFKVSTAGTTVSAAQVATLVGINAAGLAYGDII